MFIPEVYLSCGVLGPEGNTNGRTTNKCITFLISIRGVPLAASAGVMNFEIERRRKPPDPFSKLIWILWHGDLLKHRLSVFGA